MRASPTQLLNLPASATLRVPGAASNVKRTPPAAACGGRAASAPNCTSMVILVLGTPWM
jgi:hypothetical protein